MLPRSQAAVAALCALALSAGASAAEALAPGKPAERVEAVSPKAEVAPAAAAKPPEAAPSIDADLKRLRSEAQVGEDDSFTLRSVLWMFAAMGFVIATVYITLNYGLRRLMGVRAAGGPSLVQLVERLPLDQKASVYVLRAAGEYLVVGGGEGGLNVLHKLDSSQVEQLELKARSQAQGLSPFLQKLLSRKGGSPPPSA